MRRAMQRQLSPAADKPRVHLGSHVPQPDSCTATKGWLLDHLVGAREQRDRHFEQRFKTSVLGALMMLVVVGESKRLLQRGANKGLRDHDGNTALELAAASVRDGLADR
jgi:ankyrin repeat protein